MTNPSTSQRWLHVARLVMTRVIALLRRCGIWVPLYGGSLTIATGLYGQSVPHIVIGPPNAAALMELVTQGDQWTQTRTHIDTVLYADHNLDAISDNDLRTIFKQLSEWGLQLELEVGAIKPWSATGAGTFATERKGWERVRRLGGGFSSIAMDEPLIATRRALRKSDQYAIAETVAFIRLVRQNYPEVKIGDVEPFPAVPATDLMSWIRDLQTALGRSGLRGLDFFRLDPDWVAFSPHVNGSWRQVEAIHQFCRSEHIPFSLIYWASDYPRAQQSHALRSDTWTHGIVEEVRAVARLHDPPEQFVIESWVGAPARSVPDSDPTTFTGSVRTLLRLLQRGGSP